MFVSKASKCMAVLVASVVAIHCGTPHETASDSAAALDGLEFSDSEVELVCDESTLDDVVGAGLQLMTEERRPTDCYEGTPGPGITRKHLDALQKYADETGTIIVVFGSRQTGVSEKD